MADPDFEDDLFADLYADEEPAKPNKPEPEVKAEPLIVNGNGAVKAERVEEDQHNGQVDQQMYNNEHEQDDDEIDFNLGGNGNDYKNSNDYGAPTSQEHEAHGPGIKEDGKMFIGGLNWETTDQSLKDYFSQFGEVIDCTVMRDGASGRSRGFGFLTFRDAKTVNIVMVKEHYLDGKIIDPKRAIPRDEQERTSKIFVGGVSQEATEQDFKEYFMQFGRVVDATLMMDKDTGRPRGFGFVTFDSEAAVENCLGQPLEILGKPIEVKKAQPRGNMREEEENNNKFGRNKFQGGRGGGGAFDDNSQMQQGGMGQQAPGGMTPQLMAQYWQRMQQYFAMMQQQMAMGAGAGMAGGMNPTMMAQMQQMQQMQAMQNQMGAAAGNGGRSQSPQSPNVGMQGMNASIAQAMQAQQQAQQIQAMQQQQMMQAQLQRQRQQQQQQQAIGGGLGASNPNGHNAMPAFKAYDQQMFEQQKYEQQARGGGGGRGQGYGRGGGGGGGGEPSSWEGMYDDVPAPTAPAASGRAGGFNKGGSQGRGSQPPTGPQPAPPAGAPTGPKNAGKPGANYRGGGRGVRGGFHPYSRG